MSSAETHDPYQALRFRYLRLLLAGNLVASLGSQMLVLAVGWELSVRTNSPLALGTVGLVQLLPVLILAPLTGHFADRHDRKLIVTVSQLGRVSSPPLGSRRSRSATTRSPRSTVACCSERSPPRSAARQRQRSQPR